MKKYSDDDVSNQQEYIEEKVADDGEDVKKARYILRWHAFGREHKTTLKTQLKTFQNIQNTLRTVANLVRDVHYNKPLREI